MSLETLSGIPTQDVPKTSESELARIMEEQRVELDWWADQRNMETAGDILLELAEGRAQVVSDIGEGYKLSAKIPENFRVLSNETKALLDEVSRRWLLQLERRGIVTHNLFLVVSSLARTTEYQKHLREQGYPAAENSTHTKLGAFDIAVQWFKENRPELLEALDQVITDLKREQEFNLINEPEIGAYHFATRPVK